MSSGPGGDLGCQLCARVSETNAAQVYSGRSPSGKREQEKVLLQCLEQLGGQLLQGGKLASPAECKAAQRALLDAVRSRLGESKEPTVDVRAIAKRYMTAKEDGGPTGMIARKHLLSTVVDDFEWTELKGLGFYNLRWELYDQVKEKGPLYELKPAAGRQTGVVTPELTTAVAEKFQHHVQPAVPWVSQPVETKVLVAPRSLAVAQVGAELRADGYIVSDQTVRRLMPSDIANARRCTDMCHLCEEWNAMLTKVLNLFRRLDLPTDVHLLQQDTILDSVKEACYNEAIPAMERIRLEILLPDMEVIRKHRICANRQDNAHVGQVAAIEEGLRVRTLLILIDFKQNVTTGKGPRERDNAFFGYSSASVCGMWVYLSGCEPFFVAAVSLNLSHTAGVAGHVLFLALEETRKRHPAGFGSVMHFIVWSDCGPHFRAHEFCDAVFVRAREQYHFASQELNFFVEKHGKGRCDQEFGRMEQKLKAEVNLAKVFTLGDVIRVLNSLGEVVIEYGEVPAAGYKLIVPHVSRTYCLRGEGSGKISDCGLTDCTGGRELRVERVLHTSTNNTRWAPPPDPEATPNYALLRERVSHIESLQIGIDIGAGHGGGESVERVRRSALARSIGLPADIKQRKTRARELASTVGQCISYISFASDGWALGRLGGEMKEVERDGLWEEWVGRKGKREKLTGGKWVKIEHTDGAGTGSTGLPVELIVERACQRGPTLIFLSGDLHPF